MIEQLNEYKEPLIILGDGDPSISSATANTTNAMRANCYAHVIRNCDKRLDKFTDKNARDSIRDDIGLIQLAPNIIVFENGMLFSR